MMPVRRSTLLAMLLIAAGSASAATKYYAYNMTTASDFPGVYLAPAGSTAWGKNQALNDNDRVLNVTERLLLTGLKPGKYDVKLVDKKGRTCVKHDVDLSQEHTFEIHEADLAGCQ